MELDNADHGPRTRLPRSKKWRLLWKHFFNLEEQVVFLIDQRIKYHFDNMGENEDGKASFLFNSNCLSCQLGSLLTRETALKVLELKKEVEKGALGLIKQHDRQSESHKAEQQPEMKEPEDLKQKRAEQELTTPDTKHQSILRENDERTVLRLGKKQWQELEGMKPALRTRVFRLFFGSVFLLRAFWYLHYIRWNGAWDTQSKIKKNQTIFFSLYVEQLMNYHFF